MEDNKENIKNIGRMVSMSKYTPQDISFEVTREGWYKYGSDNYLPQYLLTLSKESPLHSTLCSRISQRVLGQGIESLLPATRTKIAQLQVNKKLLPGLCHDIKIFGCYFIEVVWSLDHTKVLELNWLPAENCRIHMNDDDEINGVSYSRDWRETRKERNRPIFYPMFNVKLVKEVEDDDTPKNPNQSRQVLYKGMMCSGSDPYPLPDYIGTLNYIEIDRQLGSYHCNNIMNGFFPSHLINFNNGVPPAEEQDEKIRAFELRKGTANAGIQLYTFNDSKERATEIVAFPLSDADKQYQQLDDATTMKVMRSHGVVSPLLIGIRDGAGLGSNKDELIVANKLFMKEVISPYQELLKDGLAEVLAGAGVVPQIEFKQNELPFDEDPITPDADPATDNLSKVEPVQMTEDDSKFWLTRLKEVGEQVDTDEWDLLEETEVCDIEGERNFIMDKLASAFNLATDYSNAGDKSAWGDAGLYKLRYGYSLNIDADSREFCKEMVSLAAAGTLYRYEDIANMGSAGVNGSFAPAGSSTYDIFTWKGGVYCHHHWKRYIFLRKRGPNGAFLPNKGLKNDKRVANNPFVPQKGAEGTAPIDTPTRGSLK